MIRHSLAALLAALCLSFTASAQARVDSTLLGIDILSLVAEKGAGTATVNQSYEIRNALARHIVNNESTKLQGYRVRIFFDSSQTARARSQAVATGFSENYPDVPVYRSHVSPFFKVTVGDFRTHDEAQRFASKLTNSGVYRVVFVVKEQINYPCL